MSLEALLLRIGRSVAVLAAVVLCAANPHPAAAAGARAAPVKLAVFDFEFEDGSAGALLAGDRDADEAHLQAVTTEVRRTIEQSGRYRLVDVSGADAAAAKEHSLRHCNGCDAKIASALGAEQSLVGVVRRITRTEYVVSVQLRDANTGAILASRQSDLQMGANYSWSRGAVRFIEDSLLNIRD